jgi:hypothetical protein
MTAERIKHGTVCENTQNVFWSYDSGGRERWFSPEKFNDMRIRSRESQKKNYWKNVEVNRQRMRDWHCANKDKKKTNFKNWIDKNRGKVRGTRLLRNYGLTNDDYISMFESQIGLCSICGEQQQGVTKDGEARFLCVDHCHSTGKVRELLCVKCNAGLGQFRDNPNFLTRAANYLIKHQPQGMQQ